MHNIEIISDASYLNYHYSMKTDYRDQCINLMLYYSRNQNSRKNKFKKIHTCLIILSIKLHSYTDYDVIVDTFVSTCIYLIKNMLFAPFTTL